MLLQEKLSFTDFKLTKGYKEYIKELQHRQVLRYKSLEELSCATTIPRMLITVQASEWSTLAALFLRIMDHCYRWKASNFCSLLVFSQGHVWRKTSLSFHFVSVLSVFYKAAVRNETISDAAIPLPHILLKTAAFILLLNDHFSNSHCSFVFPIRSSPAQLKMHICVGMFQEVFNSQLPCPSLVSQFLFKVPNTPTHTPCKMVAFSPNK